MWIWESINGRHNTGKGNNMNKLKKVVLCLSLVFILTACGNTKEVSNDFWSATIEALEERIESNQYNEGNWQIGVEDLSMADPEDTLHRSATIRWIEESENITEKTMFSLQNNDTEKEIIYIYERSEIVGENQYDSRLEVSSSDSEYKNYEITYRYQEFRYDNYFDGKDATGALVVADDNSITYDNMPLLKETMEHCLDLINQFQKEFNVNYTEYDFISLPELCKNIDIPTMENIPEEIATTTDFYSEPTINAKGFSLVNHLSVDKSYLNASLGVYNVERRTYDTSSNMTLEKRNIENCYNMIAGFDAEISYAVYFQEETAYLYLQSTSDEEIENDVINNQGQQASIILKTTNESYQDIIVQ